MGQPEEAAEEAADEAAPDEMLVEETGGEEEEGAGEEEEEAGEEEEEAGEGDEDVEEDEEEEDEEEEDNEEMDEEEAEEYDDDQAPQQDQEDDDYDREAQAAFMAQRKKFEEDQILKKMKKKDRHEHHLLNSEVRSLSTVEMGRRAELIASRVPAYMKHRTGGKALSYCKAYKTRFAECRRSTKHIVVPETEPTIGITFDAPRWQWNEDDREELAMIKRLRASKSEYRTAIMCLGMMQAFKVINDVDIEWPPMFTLFAGWFSLFSFTFDFFKPECSVKTAYWKTWLGMAMMPYLIMLPLILSYFLAKVLLFGDCPDPKVKSSLLQNALAKLLCTVAMIFMPMHFIQVAFL